MIEPSHPNISTRQPPNPELAALPNLYLFHPNNRNFIEGRGQRYSQFNFKIYLIVMFSLILLGVFLATSLISDHIQNRQLDEFGVNTYAVVMANPGAKFDALTYSLTYQFVVDGPKDGQHTEYSVERQVQQARYIDHEIGSQLPISYLPSNPTMHKILGEEFPIGFTRGLAPV